MAFLELHTYYISSFTVLESNRIGSVVEALLYVSART